MPYDGALKRCSRCRALLPPTREHFNRDQSRPDGLAPRCKACANAAAARSKRRHRARTLASLRAWNNAHPGRDYTRDRGYRNVDRAYALMLRADPCSFCGRRPANGVVRIDARGGHSWTNLTAACRRCRLLKRGTPLLLHLAGVRVDLRPRRRRRKVARDG